MKYRAVKLTVLLTILLSAFVFSHPASTTSNANAAPELQRRSPTNRRRTDNTKQAQTSNYSRFSHQVAAHQMACSSCHKVPTANWNTVRKGKDAFEDITDYPSHASCLNCHRQQFFKGAQPTICTICHTSPGPRNSSRHPFANPREIFDQSPKGQTAISQFEVFFPHDKHEGMFGQHREPAATLQYARFLAAPFMQTGQANPACATCHQLYKAQGDEADEFVTPAPKDLPEDAFWLKKGAFMASPTSHATCFSCHSQGGGMKPEPADCSMCHKLSPPDKLTEAQSDFDSKLAAKMAIKDKTLLEKWSSRQAGRFRHEWISHVDLKCSDCHNAATINTASGKGAEVNVLSCGGSGSGCHVTKTSDEGGALNFEVEQRTAKATFQCTKCHINEGKKPIPESHSKALIEIKKR